eukprot:g10574.t1
MTTVTRSSSEASAGLERKGVHDGEDGAINGGAVATRVGVIGDKDMGLPVKDKERCPKSKGSPLLTWQDTNIGAGLDNLGSTCYMNAILQCLSHLPLLAERLLRRKYREGVAPILTQEGAEFGNDEILGAMQNHVEQIHRVGRGAEGRQAIKPTVFINNLKKIGRKFRRGRQEDAHEFLRHRVDKMAADFVMRRRMEATAASKNLAETTPIHDIFGGSLRSQLK